MTFFTQKPTAWCIQKIDHSIDLQEKRHFFAEQRRKSLKILTTTLAPERIPTYFLQQEN
jgi:hypothetical protein